MNGYRYEDDFSYDELLRNDYFFDDDDAQEVESAKTKQSNNDYYINYAKEKDFRHYIIDRIEDLELSFKSITK